jgi:Uma2 family endonuclease
MSTGTALITAEEFAELRFDYDVELVRGEVVRLYGEDYMTRPSQAHGGVCLNVALAIGTWARQTGLGRATTNDSWITTTRSPDSVRGADVAYFRMERLPDGKLPRAPSDIMPNLCVEVLSPSNTRKRVREKLSEYLAAGAEEVWVLDPDARTLVVHRPETKPQLYSESDLLQTQVMPGFEIAVSEFFEGI